MSEIMPEFVEVVIKMEKNEYLGVKSFPDGTTSYPVTKHLYDAVRKGTLLPKGHGRLIDVIRLKVKMFELSKNSNRAYWDGVDAVGDLIDKAPTIIEADRREEPNE